MNFKGLSCSVNLCNVNQNEHENHLIYSVIPQVHPSYKGNLCGACSNYDGDSSTVTGPKGCSYSDYDMFMASWAMPGDGCDDAALAAKKDQVKAYQASCNKQFIYPTGQVLTGKFQLTKR